MLDVNFTNFSFGEKQILKEISFSLKEGESLTILGSNGAGKSTLAKLICGLYASEKSIMIEGAYVESYTHKERAGLLNYIPPKLSIYESYITVEDFLALSRFKGSKREDDITKLLSLFGLEKLQKKHCSTLSSGEGQLLLFLSALLHGATMTLFDEPTSNLDPQKIKQVYEILQSSDYIEQKIIITHNLQFAYKLGFPILYIKEGVGVYFPNVETFFAKENLEKLFEGSVVKNGTHIEVVL